MSESKKTVVNPRTGSAFDVSDSGTGDQLTSEEQQKAVQLGNKYISHEKEDVLYHLGLSNFGNNLREMFGDVKFVCMGGSSVRSERFAHDLADRFSISIPTGLGIAPIGKTERYSLFKVGPIISVNHGMGMPSMSILLHEMTKLLFHAGASSPTFIRIGTSGGVGVEPGTVVVTTEGINGKLEPCYEQVVLGKTIKRPTLLDSSLADLAVELAKGDDNREAVACTKGKTIGTDDFYEGQGRMDGSEVCYGHEEREAWLKAAYEVGVRNIEMESTCFAAWCHRAKIPGMICCAALLNRLNGDQVTSPPQLLASYSSRAQEVALRVMEHKLKK